MVLTNKTRREAGSSRLMRLAQNRRKETVPVLTIEVSGDEIPGDDEEDVDPDVPARQP
jgi:hypothetical protein